ncbi:MAG: hypothetical protein QG579_51 [Patescibacteria group bacterium]|nr:hypothetical protein [Patescibacteria group bacterium]
MKICSKCKKEKTLLEFNFKSKILGLRNGQCKECTRLLIKNHYNKNKEYYLNKAKKRNFSVKLDVINFLQSFFQDNPCVDCGENDITVLEFDHKGKIPKFRAVSSMVRNGFTLEKIKEEVSKCEVRCANCHRRKTAKDFGWFKSNNALVAQRIEYLSSEQGVGGSSPSERTKE